MHDEIDRSRKLTVPNLETPYFIEYLVDEDESFTVSATLGGLTSRRRDKFRNPDVNVRVGDYKFDNTNYRGGDFGFGSRYDLERFPLENSYPVLRRYLWLATDSAYKSAVEAISRKRAALAQPDGQRATQRFCARRAGAHRAQLSTASLDEDAWADRVRTLSAIFDQYPDVKASGMEFGRRRRRLLPGEFRRHGSARARKRGRICERAPWRRRPTA